MTMITDPDLLQDSAADDGSQEVFINTSTKRIKFTKVGALSDDGVYGKCLYSFLKEQWLADPHNKNLPAFAFPMDPLGDESYEFKDGWDLEDDASRNLMRTVGWTVRNIAGAVISKWSGIVGLGTIEADDQLYYQQESGGSSTSVVLTGQVNQAVQVLSDPNGDGSYVDGFDRRAYFKLFAREYQQAYGGSSLGDIGVLELNSIVYRFPVSTASDAIKVTHDDATVSSGSPYTEIKIRYFSAAFTKAVDTPGVTRSFGIVVDVGTHSGIDGSAPGGASVLTTAEGGMSVNAYADGVLTIHSGSQAGTSFPIVSNTATTITVTGTIAVGAGLSFTAQLQTPVVATAEQIYEKVQWSLRQAADIDATSGSVTGKTADLLFTFVGDTLKALAPSNPRGGGAGVLIEGFKTGDTNRLVFKDNGGTERSYPYVATLNIVFGDNARADADFQYWVYFSTLPGAGNDWGEAGAVIVQDKDGEDMTGLVSSQSSVTHSFNYDGNTQGGRVAGTDATITVVGIGKGVGQAVRATGTIQKSTSNSVSLVAALERNYSNP